MIKYSTKISELIVVPESHDIFSEYTTRVSIDDEGAGGFIVISQTIDDYQKIKIDVDEWPYIKDAVERIIAEIKQYEVDISRKETDIPDSILKTESIVE